MAVKHVRQAIRNVMAAAVAGDVRNFPSAELSAANIGMPIPANSIIKA